MIEYKNQFNSFSSLKGLTYFKEYQQIVAWMNGAKYLPPPRECNLDPYAECNARCTFCNSQRYLRNHRQEVGEMRKLPTEYCLKLVDVLAKWGTALCISGGGDPSLHDGMPEVLNYARKSGIETSFVTNAIKISHDLAESLMSCRWVAMSVDASNREDYEKIKGVDKFREVCDSINGLSVLRDSFNSKVDLAFKMLVLEDNYTTIYDACKLAKALGCSTFHVRPCNYEREDIEGHKSLKIDIEAVLEQFDWCHQIETDTFKVFTITHKFDKNFHIKQDFKKCWSTPLLVPILTDGNVYICVDHKLKPKFKMASVYPNPQKLYEFWGSDAHREFIKKIVPKVMCKDVRCTFGVYSTQIEQCVLQDNLYVNFP